MKVHLIHTDQGGSGFLRVLEPARVAKLAGIDVSYSHEFDVNAVRQPNGLIEVKELYCDADVLVLQRPLPQAHYACAIAAKRQGIAIAVELDDDFHNVHPDNVAAKDVDPIRSPLENRNWLMKTLGLADVVITSTPRLQKYTQGLRQGVVVRNRLPRKVLDIPLAARTGRVGWTGTTTTHPADLQRARGVLDQTEAMFAVVGDITGVARAIGTTAERVVLASPWTKSVPEFWHAVMPAFDVGIAPLETSKFNKAKSWLKPMEFLALGKPFVASPLPEYRLLVEESGAGTIATSAAQWAARVREMLDDATDYRKAAAAWALENTLERHISDWISAWELTANVGHK